ncbi:DUF222 domain-containing protein [Actinoplanes sp. NPDC026619]|uniref:HNH endonuclease signature motif containing protein n=1 Tax=Actinoplanes sp. NPDC026619 TaxID=3155798 RepID=UPI003409F074
MLEELTRTRAALAECAGAAVWALPDADLLASLEEAWTGVQQLTAVAARLVRQAEVRGLPAAEAASSTVVWLRQRLHASPADAQRLVRLGELLDASPALDAAVSAGAVSTEQARAIGTAIADLPEEAGIETLAKAEKSLIAYASQFDPMTLSQLGTRILAHVDPEAGDRYDEAVLRRQEERARHSRGFTLSPFGDGRVRLSGWLERAAAATVSAALAPLCRPDHATAGDTDLARTPTQRRADALVEVCARVLRDGGLPTTGGDAAQVVVTIPIATLQTVPGTALQTGDPSPTCTPRNGHRPAGHSAPTSQRTDGHRRRGKSPTGPPNVSPGGAKAAIAASDDSIPTDTTAASAISASMASGGTTPAGATPAGATPAGATPAGATPASVTPVSAVASPVRPAPVDGAAGSGGVVQRDSSHGVLDNGALISPAEARVLACDARIIPAVLGTAGQVLDVGRARRLISGPIRRALILRDRGCSFPGCDRPPNWSEGHHVIPWADGGPTALTNACLLCRHHHRVIHQTGWQVRISPDGRPEFLPPATIDPQRRPRRNAYHLRL